MSSNFDYIKSATGLVLLLIVLLTIILIITDFFHDTTTNSVHVNTNKGAVIEVQEKPKTDLQTKLEAVWNKNNSPFPFKMIQTIMILPKWYTVGCIMIMFLAPFSYLNFSTASRHGYK
ncbi:hypothetical protein [Terribacillus saccharophilus]|uniref:hypothetical protein n=1 Tax=Terribacillus saccharophilus TaxID=361277 RepID=UPI002989A009|nr:hypothetical protein [Terribacillus saccharophilus]MCM3227518.1 hypothetical protein [Terribacillus saccharophilus]